MKIEDLVNKLKKAKEEYYNRIPIMSDIDFDEAEDKLRNLDPTNSYFDIVGAPNYGNKIKHNIPMLSMSKAKTVENVDKWIKKILNIITKQEIEIIIEPKIDGVSGEIYYENGQLKHIATRGNGLEGSDVSHIKNYIDIPKNITIKSPMHIRGEFYLSKKNTFAKDKLRNVCSGLVNRKENLSDLKHIKFIAYQIVEEEILSEKDVIDILQKINFLTPEVLVINSDKKLLDLYYELYKSKLREKWDYETDGLVIIINNKYIHNQIDANWNVSHHHHYNIALKPEKQTAETILKGIEWNISVNGFLIPKAIVEPVKISGTEIQRIALNNYGYMKEFNLHPGDKLLISRANEIIPHLEENLSNNNSPYDGFIPTECSSCKSKLVKNGIHLCCDNDNCEEKQFQKIMRWINNSDLDGISEQTIRVLYNKKIINNIIDLYTANFAFELEDIPGFGEKKINNLIQQLEKSKTKTISEFADCIDIQLVGSKTIKNYNIKDMEDFMNYNDIQYVAGRNLIEWRKKNNKFIEEILNYINIKKAVDNTMEENMISVCMTGKGPKTRNELVKEIEAKNHRFISSVNKDTNILVCENTDGTSSKLQKARKLGIKLISYGEYFGE